MAASLETLSHDALELAPDQRVALAHLLFDSVEAPIDPEVEAAWTQEIARRIARFDAGEATLVPAEEVHAELRRIVTAQRQAPACES